MPNFRRAGARTGRSSSRTPPLPVALCESWPRPARLTEPDGCRPDKRWNPDAIGTGDHGDFPSRNHLALFLETRWAACVVKAATPKAF